MRAAIAFLSLFLCCGCLGQWLESRRLDRLTYEETQALVHKYAAEGNTQGLLAICHSKAGGLGEAAWEVSRRLTPPEEIKFCRSFPEGSLQWANAFCTLRHHPRREVIDYIRDIEVVAVQAPVAGLYDSALARTPLLTPPTTSTLPSGSRVAVW